MCSHTYDTNIATYSFYYPPWSASADTPNIYGNWFAGNNGGGAGQVISFYNTNDFALQRSVWQRDELLKPDQNVLQGLTLWDYAYGGSINDPAPWNKFYKYNAVIPLQSVTFDIVNVLTNRYEVMGFAAQSWTTALGATPGVGHLTGSFDMTRLQNPRIWPSDPTGNDYIEYFWHSAEFRGDNAMMQSYWSELLGSEAFGLK